MMMNVILISGLKRSGKDFVAEKLQEKMYSSKVFSLAEPLKDIVADTFGISRDKLDEYKNNADDVYVNDHPTCETWVSKLTDFRTILQRFGTDAMKKHFGDDVWVNLLIDKLYTLSFTTVIVSDWRFISEYNAFADVADVWTVRVHDDNLTPDDHASETELMDFNFDLVVDNTAKDDSILAEVDRISTTIGSYMK